MALKRDFYFSKSSVVRKEKVILDKLSRQVRGGMTEAGISLKDMLTSILETNPGFLDDYVTIPGLPYVGLTGDESVAGKKTWEDFGLFEDGIGLEVAFANPTGTTQGDALELTGSSIYRLIGGVNDGGVIMNHPDQYTVVTLLNVDPVNDYKIYPGVGQVIIDNGVTLPTNDPLIMTNNDKWVTLVKLGTGGWLAYRTVIPQDTLAEYTSGAANLVSDNYVNLTNGAGIELDNDDPVGTLKIIINSDPTDTSTVSFTTSGSYYFRSINTVGTPSYSIQPGDLHIWIKTGATSWIGSSSAPINGRPRISLSPVGTQNVQIGVKYHEVIDASAGSLRLPTLTANGDEVVIKNSDGVNTLTIEAGTGDTINGVATFNIPISSVQKFVKVSSANWITF